MAAAPPAARSKLGGLAAIPLWPRRRVPDVAEPRFWDVDLGCTGRPEATFRGRTACVGIRTCPEARAAHRSRQPSGSTDWPQSTMEARLGLPRAVVDRIASRALFPLKRRTGVRSGHHLPMTIGCGSIGLRFPAIHHELRINAARHFSDGRSKLFYSRIQFTRHTLPPRYQNRASSRQVARW